MSDEALNSGPTDGHMVFRPVSDIAKPPRLKLWIRQLDYGWVVTNDGRDVGAFSDAKSLLAYLNEALPTWTIQWYPDTPVGFYCVAASTLEAAIDAALGRTDLPGTAPR